ncbi:hypothetical protein FPSE_02567 [Fusarium pseudograminearum CS3096]|uniref:Uncharacterized protein n=1 Tax=Fusarium pseudograminearum (strain CS3096) TaxID=1028729 RepID=K3VPM5_FUSPC|nr:hypothetical protein FPSE_02567 [Fusarium pseudograminearum CS3096]EKJ77292.1 hypothetical protein FPSE_02567 [Fusarium pseudograminearum CS3096]
MYLSINYPPHVASNFKYPHV